ncbi:PQLC3 protein, partial [Rhodinocichla rosea]|nr:PQLC3 protein [Rhodinocichla rosea]
MAPGLLDLVHLTTWAVCAVIKLPQLVAVLRAGSAWGLSVSSLLLELAGLLVFLRYQIYYGYPLETYLEFPVIIAQDVILLSCIMHFSGKVRRACFYALVYWVGWYMITLQKWIIDLAMNLCTLISVASKLVQLQHLWETKDAGQASALTWGMSVYASAGKLQTTCVVTAADFFDLCLQYFFSLLVLIRFIVMLILNIWVTATILHYRKIKKTD